MGHCGSSVDRAGASCMEAVSLLHVILSLSPLFPVQSFSCPVNKGTKPPKYLKNKNKTKDMHIIDHLRLYNKLKVLSVKASFWCHILRCDCEMSFYSHQRLSPKQGGHLNCRPQMSSLVWGGAENMCLLPEKPSRYCSLHEGISSNQCVHVGLFFSLKGYASFCFQLFYSFPSSRQADRYHSLLTVRVLQGRNRRSSPTAN